MDQTQAEQFIVEFIRRAPQLNVVHVPAVVEQYIFSHEEEVVRAKKLDARKNQLSPLFMEAAWDLALLGVLRPGLPTFADSGAKFNGTAYSLTDFGRRWVNEGTEDAFVPVGSETFVELLQPYQEFGSAFLERAREASRCWKVKAFLACCTMCGAAAEAVLLSAAIAKTNDAATVLATYNSRSGRKKVENLLVGAARSEIKEAVGPLFNLVKYWRDESSHGGSSGIAQPEARTSLQALFLYARFVHRNWSELTAP